MWEKQMTMKIIEFHTNYDNKDLSQWNCMNFDFQANRRDNLKKENINFKPTKGQDLAQHPENQQNKTFC